ncbi:MAG: hypothetical protein N2C12_13740, partial [Planctomycetales bacterium]
HNRDTEEFVPELPFAATRTALASDGSSESAEFSFLNTADGGASFSFSLDLFRTGVADAQSSMSSSIFFQVTEESTAEMDGLFRLDGGGRMSVAARLRDMTVGGGYDGVLFSSVQLSNATSDEVFQVGGLGGDASNQLIGTLPVTLIPGHEYLFEHKFECRIYQDVDEGASATGNLEFIVAPGSVPGGSDPNVAPEPGSIFVWSLLALCGVGFGWRRRAHRDK